MATSVYDSEKLQRDLDYLMACLREMLTELGEEKLAQSLPWTGSLESVGDDSRTVRAWSIAFQLLSMAEENASVQLRRARETKEGLLAEPGLWGKVLEQIKGVEPDEGRVAEKLARVRVEPVLTAHPTEAKRGTVLRHLRELYMLLVKKENSIWTPTERLDIRNDIIEILERLWHTGEIHLEKPHVLTELDGIIYHLSEIFPQVVPIMDRRIRHAWREAGLQGDPLAAGDHLPKLSFSTWVGGDRDGHPLVTAEVTEQALKRLRLHALMLIHGQLTNLASKLSISQRLVPPSQETLQRIEELAALTRARGAAAIKRNPEEPLRQLVNLMKARLPIDLTESDQVLALDPGTRYRFSAELAADLRLLRDSLIQVGARRLALTDVVPVLRTVQVFGFHLASLDVRQNSAFHDKAIEQLMAAAGMKDCDFSQWDEEHRLAFLNHELTSPRPFVRFDARPGKEAESVIDCYRVLASHIAQYGGNGLGSLIVSMTRNLSDLLVVYLLAREAGLTVSSAEGRQVCMLPVVPLFETIEDLQASPGILERFLEHPITRRTLAHLWPDDPVQQVMIGYSDSNKDGGIMASLWGLYRGQEAMLEAGRRQGVRLRFFHGRGGTISRGAGPTNRFLRGLPHGSAGGDMRLTEQGESITQKYSNPMTAAFHLELLLAGTAGVTLSQQHAGAQGHELQSVMDTLAQTSRAAYEKLVRSDGFITFFRQATPIDVIESSSIGSRPARRTGTATLADLRAIPWVFSWSQARYYLSGWYGTGTALEQLLHEDEESFNKVAASFQSWTALHYIISNVATSVATANPGIMEQYAGLVEDEDIRQRIFGDIREEYERTVRMMERIYGGTLAERRRNVHNALARREEALLGLHRRQIELLRHWRQGRDAGGESSPQQLHDLLETVNAIAAGLGTTG